MLDDCFQLISLAYLTVGKNHEPPAVLVFNNVMYYYDPADTVVKILLHLNDQGIYVCRSLLCTFLTSSSAY